MNFEDPFANDLSRVRSAVASLGRLSSPSSLSVSGGLAGGPRGSPSAASPVLSSGMSADSSVGLGATPLKSAFLSSGATSVWGPSPTSAPVAGRRARVEPNATGASLGPPSAGGTSASSAIQAASPSGAEAPAASALSWLEEMDSSPPPAASATVTPSPFSAPPPPRPAGQALSLSSSIPPFLMTDVVQEQSPSFLDFASTGASSAGGPVHSLRPRGAPAAAARLPTNTGGAAADAADAAGIEERKKKEIRDLYATLDALDVEQGRLEESVGDRQVREETELLALETSVLVKTTELEEKEQELASRRAELKRYTVERLEALASRYAKEMEAQAAEVRSLDGARLEKQLQHVCDMRSATEQTVRELRERAALVLEMQPYSEAGVRLALFSTNSNVAVPPTGDADSPSPTAGAAGASSAEPSSTELGSALQRAVMVLRGYCDKRLRHTRDNLVDYVHTSTLDAAHSVRRGREQAWMQDAVQHKQVFSRYMVDMMQRYMAFYKERAAVKQDNIAALQADVRRMAAQLRGHAAERLQQLLRDVTARITLSTQRHTQAAEEARALLQKKANTIVEGDMAMADAQHRELEGRLLAEANARRQRHHAEEESLTEQLQRLRRSGEAANRNAFQAIRDAASATSSQHAQPLREEVLALKTRLVERLRGGASGVAAACSAARMHAEELTRVLRSTMAQEAARQQGASLLRQQCDELRRGLTSLCTEAVERLQQTRCAQHAHQARIDALAKSWEAAHRQNLAAACSLILPVSSSTPGTADAQYVSETYAAPQDVVSAALLDVLQDKLRARDDKRRSLLASRRQCTAASLSRLEEVRDAQATLQDRCAELWSAAQTQATQQRITQEMEVEVEKGLITVAAEQRVADRDRRVMARRSRRIAELTSSLRHEPPQHLLCSLLSPPLQEVVTTHLARAHPLGTVDINAIPKVSSSNNTFTAVHTSNNAATTVKKSSAEVSSSSSSSSPASGVFQVKRGEEAPVTPQKMCCTPNTAELSYATDTHPWSSAPLRAEQRLLHAGTGESSDVSPAARGSQQGRPQSDSVPTAHHGMCNEAAAKVLTSSQGAQQVDTTRVYRRSADMTVEAEGDAYSRDLDPRNSGSRRAAADEKQRGGSWPRDASLPPVSSTWAADSDTTPPARTCATITSPAVLPAQPQRQQSLQALHTLREPTVSQPTWSTLEEYRSSSVDVPNRAAAGTSATFNFTATGSLDDWSDFLALLSFTDSPASSITS
ncbi:hypothetical protein conserved [Leishmania donovani]|uniref:Hypothetical_protein_conserved n=1 Tax=Leishmania donovani TaxID=5661 RepID=A0A6J8FA94_LEIDO|nr:hypothetical protein conserved [Leishmania donovani]VDZ43033.1 hypothetical_protein_conserved [Leishmania donovani]